MSRVHYIWMVIWLVNIKLCNSSGKLGIRFLRFKGNSRVNNGDCCDNAIWCLEACDIYLKICVTEVPQAKCNAGNFQTKVLGKGSFTFPGIGGDLGNGRKNPLEYSFQKWQGFSLTIEMWDYDSGFIKGSSDFVDSVHLDIADAPDQNSTSASNKPKRMASNSSPKERYIDLQIKIHCDDNYLLPDCARECIPRDDASGHYTCDYVRGLIMCNQHWYGDRCTQFCRPRNDGLGNYTCDKFGAKICAGNWFGGNCSTFCKSTDGPTGHYKCDGLTGNKVCLPNWYGGDCLVFCKAQDSSDGHYSCNKTSGEKDCLRDWYGANCTKYCSPQNDRLLGHFKCDVTGDKVCLPGWRGRNCTQALTALITCYNKLELWIDGVWYGPDNAQWKIAWSFQISTNATLIAVKAVQYGDKGGILGSLSGGLVTDGVWKCTKRFHSNWMTLTYDDSAWPRARTYGYNGAQPWSKIARIANNANWIWTADNKNDGVVYCRRLLTEILPTSEAGRPTTVQPSYNTKNTNTQTPSTTLDAIQPTSFARATLKTSSTIEILSPVMSSSWNVNQLDPTTTVYSGSFHVTSKHGATPFLSPAIEKSKQFSQTNEMTTTEERQKASTYYYKTQTFNEFDHKTSTFKTQTVSQQNVIHIKSLISSTATFKAENPRKSPQADTSEHTSIKAQSSLAINTHSHSHVSERNSQSKSPIENGTTETHVTETLEIRNSISVYLTHQNFSTSKKDLTNNFTQTLTNTFYHRSSTANPSSSLIKETLISERNTVSLSTENVKSAILTRTGIAEVETSSPVSETRSVVITSSRSLVSATRSVVLTSSSNTTEMNGGKVWKKDSFVLVFFPPVVFMMVVGLGICIKMKKKKLILRKVVPVNDNLLSKDKTERSSQIFKIPHSQSQQELLQMDVFSTNTT